MSKILSCDICGKQIRNDISYYIFKSRNKIIFKEYDVLDEEYMPRRLDVCKKCFSRFVEFVFKETEEKVNGTE